ncbi:MAG: hypothetical protein ABI772_06740 [Bacteroidota bacterium]
MDFEHIIFIIAAAIAWLYNNYNKLQKEAVERSRKISSPPQNQQTPAPAQVTTQTITRQVKQNIRRIKKEAPENEERKKTEVFWKRTLASESSASYIKADVDKNNIDEQTLKREASTAKITEEIYSENVDWKKAFIYSEILRPVYF